MSSSAATPHRANRLAQSTSPYLLQHAHNPVDWHPWGAEALQLAREQNKPIFLSIGYSACHWCHVMERESFEHEGIARLMNEYFVNIKVDREERPDLDEIYMKAVQAISGSGGWPMSVWLTPDLRPFFGGTYFPPAPRYGKPSFPQLVQWIGETWRRDPDKLHKQGADLTSHIAKEEAVDTRGEISKQALDQSLAMLAANYDPSYGGFGGAPKFPHAMDIRILLRHHRRLGAAQPLGMATHTLERMARGGIYDHLAGGFHRYSTDERWLIPHFEKMLYDNALLVPAYVEAWLVTREPLFRTVASECCDWVLAEMVTAQGAFASTLDADTEGEEGRYYVWTPEQLSQALPGRAGAWAQEWWGVTPTGNFEHGTSALWRDEEEADVAKRLGTDVETLRSEMEGARRRLLALRATRVPPGKDDKVLVAWNGLMIS
ncbi:MAG: thioredoxin domain-containing protein, partial [Planctomycetota bacterium]